MFNLFKNSNVGRTLFFCHLLSTCFSVYSYAQTTLKVGVYDNKPIIFINDDGAAQGLFVDILEEVAIKENWRLEYVSGQFSDIFTQLREGKIDLLPAIAYSKQREQIIDYTSETIMANWAELYVSVDKNLSSLLELEGKKIGVTKGDIHFTALKELTNRFNISCRFIEADQYETVFEMLEANFVDVGVVNRLYGNRNKQKYSVKATPVIYNPIEIRFGSTKGKNQDILTIIDSYMLDFSADRQSIYYQSFNRWFNVDSEKVIPRWVFYLLIAVVGVTLFFFLTSLLLRRQVQRRTEDLANTNSRLESQILERTKAEIEKGKLEARLNQAQKMEAIGTLAGGIAHDFNNILSAILGYTELAKDDCKPGSTIEKDLEKVLASGNRAKGLVQQILAFSRQSATEFQYIQPASIVKETINMLRPSLPTTIEIIENIDPATGHIFADPSQISQIVMNLSTNAFHAMEEAGGRLSISLKETAFKNEELIHEQGVTAGVFIKLSICDSGPGMTQEVKDKIFDPYFTTKGIGKGTGMGLSIVHGSVKSYGGFIILNSELGKGSDFQIFFPVLEEPVPHKIDAVEQIPAGEERILFIDDEAILAEMGKHMLERLGYHVTVRKSSLEALETFQNQPDQFDIVITDQTMPGMTGVDLARRMMQIRPDIPIILCTGYSSIISEEKAKSMGIKEFALKPLAKKDIAKLIRKALVDNQK